MAKFSISTAESEQRQSVLELARTLEAITEEMEPLLKSHSGRVANNCANFSEEFKLMPDADVFNLYIAGLLHDFGLIFFPETLLKDDESRSDDEKIQMRKHPVVAEKILSNLSILKEALPLIRHHHEAIDGSGYPDALAGDEIPLGARILFLFNPYFGPAYCLSQKLDALVIGLTVDRVRDAVLTAMGEAVAGGVAVAGGDAVNQLGDEAQGPNCLGPHPT